MVALFPAHGRVMSAESGAGTVVGGLSVATDPAGAVVYVDGRFAGRTPLDIPDVAVGDHRLRVVKDGYLENARVVSVSAGAPRKVAITLTADGRAPAAAAAQVTGGGGGGGLASNKWLWIGVAGGAAAGALAYTSTRNTAPTPGTIGFSPNGVGMAGHTTFSFTAQGASDSDGDSLTYTWNFGDGGTGFGQTASHVFTAAGSHNVTLDVSDGSKSASAPAASVTVGPNLTGMWSGGRNPFFGCGVSISATQNGGTLTGSMVFGSPYTGSVPLMSGTATPLTHPSTVSGSRNPSISPTRPEVIRA